MKISQLTEQNRQLQRQLERCVSNDTAEMKIVELENKVTELNRKISQLQMQNGILDGDLTTSQEEIKKLQESLMKLQSSEQEKVKQIGYLENVTIK